MNLGSVRKMLGRNRKNWEGLRSTKTKKDQEEIRLAIRRRRRRSVKLLEELSLRTEQGDAADEKALVHQHQDGGVGAAHRRTEEDRRTPAKTWKSARRN